MLQHRSAMQLVLGGLLWLLSGTLAWALDPALAITQYSQRHWQTDQGLPQNSVFSVAQTPDGYLWLATQEGLVRFDGVQFTVFSPRNTEALKANDVWTLLVDRLGSLWIGTRGGGLTRLKGGNFVNFGPKDGLSNDAVQALFQSRDGSLWIGTRGGGLNHLEGRKFSVLTVKDGLAHDNVFAVLEDKAGVLWVGTDGGGLSRYENGKFTTLTVKDGLNSNTIYALLEATDGALWIGTQNGVNRLKDGQIRRYSTAEGLSNERIRRLYQDRAGNIWVGTDGGGLNRLANDRFTALTSAQGLSGDNVGAIFEDREGSLWVGSDTGGVNRLRDGSFASFSALEGLSNDNARSVLQTRDGALWVGTFGGLNRYENGQFKALTAKDGLSGDVILSLAETPDGSLWAGTLGAGLNRYQAGRFSHFGRAQGLSHETVLALKATRDGALWIGTRSGGVNRYFDGKFTVFGIAQGLASEDARCFAETADGAIWIGTLGGGLSRYKDGKFTNFTAKDGLANDNIFSLLVAKDGTLWIGSFGAGLTRYKDGKFVAIGSRNGLFDDAVFQILEDEQGSLWMSGNRGVHRSTLASLNAFADGRSRQIDSESFGKTDGMRSIEGNGGHQPAGIKDSAGNLWWPTTAGVARVNPAKRPHNELPPPVVLERLLVDDEPQSLGSGLILPPGKSKLEFHYTGLSFAAPEKVRFRYRLEGFDKNWVEADDKRVAYYTNIPHGSYRFRVSAANNDGVWSDKDAGIAFTLRPQFWQHPAFTLAWLLLAAGLAWLAFQVNRSRIRVLTERSAHLQSLVDARDAAQASLREVNLSLEQRAEELSRTKSELEKFAHVASHDLREPLRGIVGFTQLLARRYKGRLDETADSYINYAVEGAFAMRRTLDNLLAYLNVSQADEVRRAHSLQTAFDEASANLAPLIASSGTQLTHEALPMVRANTQEMVVLMQNLISNAVRFQPPGAVPKIHVSAQEQPAEKRWTITVEDNGIGIDPKFHDQIFGLFQRLNQREDYPGTGVGLAICQKIVQAHGGRIWLESVAGQGSRFHFTLPA